MAEGMSKLEAVRLARQELGEAAPAELADFIGRRFGLVLLPAVVSILLASLRERELLGVTRQKAQEMVEQARAELAQAEQARGKGRKKAPA
jgi:hypothetical protein